MSIKQTDYYAVLGTPISHSKSPRIHRLFAKQTNQNLNYIAQEVNAENFVEAVTAFFQNGGKGLNCTVPLKELAWQFAEHKTERADYAKAVNTLILQKDGSILGDNTDGIGLVNDLKNNHHVTLQNKKVLILGAGGATRGIILPLLAQQPAEIFVVNRTLEKAKNLANDFKQKIHVGCFDDLQNQQFDLVLNATSASLNNQLPPLPDDLLTSQSICYDLAYGNLPTAFVKWGKKQGAIKSVDGLGMLVEQAAEAFFIWRGIRPQTQDVITLLEMERN